MIMSTFCLTTLVHLTVKTRVFREARKTPVSDFWRLWHPYITFDTLKWLISVMWSTDKHLPLFVAPYMYHRLVRCTRIPIPERKVGAFLAFDYPAQPPNDQFSWFMTSSIHLAIRFASCIKTFWLIVCTTLAQCHVRAGTLGAQHHFDNKNKTESWAQAMRDGSVGLL